MKKLNMESMDFKKGSFATVMDSIEELMFIFEAELQKSIKNTSATPALVSLA